MGKYKNIATSVVSGIGGKENIKSLTHCITRLRFVLKDDSIPNTEAVKKIDGVVSVVEQGGQYQVVIGPKVGEVYEQIQDLLGEEAVQAEEIQPDQKQNKTVIKRLTSMLSGIFLPVIPVLAATGIIKGLLVLFNVLGLISVESETYTIIYSIADAMFYFFPIILGASASKYFKGNMWIGGVIGAIMLYPDILGAADTTLHFLGIPVGVVDYSNSVFPVVVAAFVAAKLEKILKKIIPSIVSFFLVPAIVLIITAPLTLIVVGPIITQLSNLLATGIQNVYEFSPLLCAIVLGGPWILLVMLGLHWAGITVLIIQFSTMGCAPLGGILIANQMAMAGAVFAIALRSKELRTLAVSTGASCIMGVSEPALYGILVPQRRPLVMVIIAGSLASIPAALMGTSTWVSGSVAGIFGIFGYMNPAGIDTGFYGAILANVLGLLLGFVFTYFWGCKSLVVTDSTKV